MRKHKSVVAILLAVMMIFTMMPAMAFAADENEAEWLDNYKQVKIAGWTYDTVRVYDNETGEIVAFADPDSDVDWAVPSDAVRYFDLTQAELATDGNKTIKASYQNGTYEKGMATKVKLNVPDYVANKSAAYGDYAKGSAQFADLDGGLNPNWSGVVEGDEDYKAATKTVQEFTLSVSGTWSGSSKTEPYLLLPVPSKKVTVLAKTLVPSDADYYFDSEDSLQFGTGTSKSDPYAVYYDGTEHTFMASAIDGWTPSYFVFNEATGKEDAVTAVKVTDIQRDAKGVKKPLEVTVKWTKAGETKPTDQYTKTFYVNLKEAGVAFVGFTPVDDEFMYLVSGKTYNAADYINAVPYVTYQKGMQDTEQDKTRTKAKTLDAATAKAVEANKAAILAWFNEVYEVQETPAKENPNLVDLKIVSKDLTTKEKDDIDKKYPALKNFAFVGVDDEDAFDKFVDETGTVALNGIDPFDYEIEFVNAPAKKVIKTKKAKSTKKVTFNVTAECKNGTIVKYKLINAPKKSISINSTTGKITVKKGLAVGTYTFKVKAYISGTYNRQSNTSVSEVQTVKVIVKKAKKAKKK